MKQRILVCLLLVAMAALGLCSAAFAAQDPIALDMELSSNRFSGPAEVTVTIRVTNTGDTEMPGTVALFYPDGNIISDFGTPTLAAGASKSWTGTWMVTDSQLASGRLTFAVRYSILDENGTKIEKTLPFYHSIVDAGDIPQVEINRHITPSIARKGQEVSIIYEVINTGSVDITDVVIDEKASSANGKISLVRADEKATYTFTVTMGSKDMTSGAAITYKANGVSYSDAEPDTTIKHGDVKLNATLKADKKGGLPGDTVKLTLTLKNTGKADFQNVTVTDPTLGTLFTGLTVKAGENLVQEKEITISQTADLQFTVSGSDASGATVETATGRITVTAVDPAKAVQLSVNAVADKTTVYVLPGIVKFTVSVTNTCSVEATDVTVVSNGVTLYHFDVIAPGQTRSFVRDVRVEIPGQYRFDAVAADQLDQNVTYEGNIVQIVRSSPTATPSQVPIATPARPTFEEIPQHDGMPAYVDYAQTALHYGFWVLLGLSCVFLALVVIGVVSRIRLSAKSRKAPDHLERDGYRDYTQAVPNRKRHMMPESEEPELPAATPVVADVDTFQPMLQEEEAAPEEDGSAVENTMAQLYPEAQGAQEAPAEATYRRRRRTSDDQ